MEAIIVNDWPRISYHRGEILKGLTVCWCRIKDQGEVSKGKVSKELEKVQESIEKAVRLLTSVLKTDVDVVEEYRILVDSDVRLRDLLVA